MKKHLKLLTFTIVFISGLIIFSYFSNNSITVTNITINHDLITDEVTILHLSDIHGKMFGDDNTAIKNKVDKLDFDIVVITGDLIDRRREENINQTVSFVEYLASSHPVYYVEGNHEHLLSDSKYQELSDGLSSIESNFYFLDSELADIEVNNNQIKILGVNHFYDSFTKEFTPNISDQVLTEFQDSGSFNILLDHFPTNFDYYEKQQIDFDLMLSGHAHGGQVRLPFIGGVLAPDQGFNPEYDVGHYINSSGEMVLSRGLGNSSFPLRVFNRPELVLVTLT